MGDDTRCLLYNQALDAWLEGIGTECSQPDARPIPTTDDPSTGPGNPAPSNTASAEGLDAPNPPPQQNPPPAQPPTATNNGTSTATPGGGPTAQASATPPPTQDGTDPTTPLAQQYFRPLNPLPDYLVLDNLLTQGMPAGPAADQLQRIIRNEPEPGQPHPQLGQNNRLRPTTVLDPIDPFTGAYVQSVTDLVIPSRGMDLRFTRTYRSGLVAFGPFGFNWDHSYNAYARELDAGAVAIRGGDLREDVYRPDGTGGYAPPIGVFRLLEPVAAPSNGYALTDREGVRFEFARPPGWASADRIPLLRIRDRHDNVHTLAYDAEGRPVEVSDGLGRRIELLYGTCGLLERVQDHTGRVWHYDHDDAIEHLVAVRTPPTAQFPAGLSTRFEYLGDDGPVHPALRHDIVRVRNGDGDVVCENAYGDDPATNDFNRVVYQLVGSTESSFSTTELQVVAREAPYINAPTLRVEIIDPGFYYAYTYNFRGDLLDQRFRLIADGTARLVARTFRYNEVGGLAERWEPDGTGILRTYDTTHADPRARGNLTKTEMVAGPAFAVPSRILGVMTYDSAGLRLKTSRNAAGRVTTFGYDTDLNPFGLGDLIRIDHPTTTLPGGTTQSRSEVFRYDAHGLLIEHRSGIGTRHVFEYEAAGADTGYLRRVVQDADGVAQASTFEYDVFGHRIAIVDGLGRRIEESVDALGLVERRRTPASGGGVDEVRFFYDRQQLVRREEWPRGSYDDGVITDPFIANEYVYDLLGHLAVARFGVNTGRSRQYSFHADESGRVLLRTDPLGRVTRQHFDERGALLDRHDAIGTPAESRWRASYDRAGRRKSIDAPGGLRSDFEYDPWGRLSAIVLPGRPDADRSRIEMDYNALDALVGIRVRGLTGTGGSAVLSSGTIARDERGRPVRREALGGLATIVTFDADDRPVEEQDARGNRLHLEYDGLDRIIRAVDAGGNIARRTFDAAGQLVVSESEELQADGTSRLYRSTFEYDEAARLAVHHDPLGLRTTREYDARGLPVRITDRLGRMRRVRYDLESQAIEIALLDSGGPELAVHHYETDAVGRRVAYRDPMGFTTTWAYDERDRCTSTTYPDGRVHRYRYGDLLQLASEERPDGTIISYTYGAAGSLDRREVTTGAGLAPVDPLLLVYDGLRRLVRLEQGTHTLERSYDSLSRLVSERLDGEESRYDVNDATGEARFRYPDGRVDRLEHDGLGRLVRRSLEATGALGSTGALPLSAELAAFGYNGTDQPAGHSVLGQVHTSFGYDGGGRLVTVDSSAGGMAFAQSSYVLDGDGRRLVEWATPAPQQARRNSFDALDHLIDTAVITFPRPGPLQTQAQADAAAATAVALPGLATVTFGVDADDSRIAASRPGSSDVLSVDSSRRITTLTRAGSGAGAWPFAYDGDGRLVRDDRHEYSYDGLGRLVEVRDAATSATLASVTFDPAGRLSGVTVGGMTSRHHHHGSRLIQTVRSAGPALQYTHGSREHEIVLVSDGQNGVAVTDDRHTLLAITDPTGSILERYDYESFGASTIFAPDGTTLRPASIVAPGPQFATYQVLASGLYDARARVYDPASGRFLQPDPLGYAISPDPYAYIAGDPINGIDPSGEFGLFVGIIIVAGIGVGAGLAINGCHQAIAIHEGAQEGWEWGQFAKSGVTGGAGAVALAFAPELALPLAGLGVASGVSEIRAGHGWTGAFDIAVSVVPFGFKGVREATFGPGTVWGPGPVEGFQGRLGHFEFAGRGQQGGEVNPPGVRVRPVELTRDGASVRAWEKSVSTRAPVIRQWAETTIRAQQSALENLRAGGVDAAGVLQPYEPGGALIMEHAGEPSQAALANDSSLRAEYNDYLSRAAPIAAGRVGRVPIVGRTIARYGGVTMHDLAGRNIGYTPGRGFIAFDPASDGNFPGLIGTIGFYGESVTPLQGLRLLTQVTPAGSGAGSPK